jgi:Ribosome biogenesis protein Nop16
MRTKSYSRSVWMTDMRTFEGRERRSGKALPQKLTTNQTAVVRRLLEAHGTDIEAMVRDTKLNRMLIPAGKLRKMIAAFHLWNERERCGFRVPTKRLW